MKTIFKIISVIFVSLFYITVNADTLNIVTIELAPWGFIGKDGKPTGIMYEAANKIATFADYKYTNRIVPYPRTATDIEKGLADIVLRFSNEQMAQVAIPVAEIISMPIIALGQKGVNFKKLNDLNGKTVGIIRTSFYEANFNANTKIIKYPVIDYTQMVSMVTRNRLDAGAGASVGLYYSAFSAGLKPEAFGEPLVLGYNNFILHLSKKNTTPEMIKRLKNAAKKFKDSGEMEIITAKYLGEYKYSFDKISK